MAINQLQAPINYMGMMPQVDIGRGIAEFGQVIQERRQAEQLQLQKQQQEQQYAADLQNAINNPTQKTWSEMIAKYPKNREAFESARKGYGEDRADSEFKQGFEISMAMENGKPEIAKQQIQSIIEQKKNAGEQPGVYQQIFDALESGNVSGAQAAVNASLSMIDPKKFTDFVKARVTPKEQAATLSELEAKAISAGIDAEFARPMALAELKKTQLEAISPSVREAIDFQNLSDQQKQLFQSLQILKKPPAAVTNVNVSNVDKSAANELGKLVPDLYNQANSAAAQLNELPRYRESLDKAITGPFAEQRLSAARLATALGFTGDKSVNASREVIQGLSEMALQSRGMLAGQGQITENEQALLIKARSGDINFTKGELKTIFDVSERAAKAQYEKSKKLLGSASTVSPTAQMFLSNVSMPDTPAVRTSSGDIDALLKKYGGN